MRKNKIPEAERLFELTTFERPIWSAGLTVGGMDEVGRGPLAGPVVAAVVIMPPEPLIEGVDDSKKLSPIKRKRLDAEIRERAVGYGFGWVFQDVIDEINILEATRRAFCTAYNSMGIKCDVLMIDAMTVPMIPVMQKPIIHGDAASYLIAAASIIAKTERDKYMEEAALLYPEYGFERNKGYGTAKHIEALREYGPCPLHRRTFIGGFCEKTR